MFRFIFPLILLLGPNAMADLKSAQGACQDRQAAGLVHGLAMGYVDAQGAHEIFCGGITSDRQQFELGSISKTFAGIAVAKLALENKIDLEAPISTYVPELKGTFVGTVTAHLLATHSAQLVRSFPGNSVASWSYTEDQLIAFLKTYQPDLKVLPAGTRLYSNLGFGTLALVISRVAGLPYEQVLVNEIITPLGLTDTGFINSPVKPEALVQGYNMVLSPLAFWGVSDLGVGAGGVASDLHDMMIYMQANMNPDESPLGRAMVLSQTLGLGWDSLPGTLPTWKNGLMTDGFATLLKFDPSRQEGVLVLADTYNQASILSVGNIAMGVTDTLAEPALSAEFLNAVTGVYEGASGKSQMTVSVVAGSHLGIVIKNQNLTEVARLMAVAGEDAKFVVNDGFYDDDEVQFAIDPVTQKMQAHYFSWGDKRPDGQPAFEMTGTFTKQIPAISTSK